MNIQQALKILNSKFVYTAETSRWIDKWRILRGTDKLYGDCEDYALTLMWLVYNQSVIKLLVNLTLCKFVLWHVTSPSGEGHAIVRYKQLYYDNIQRRGVTKDDLLAQGYKFKFPMLFPYAYLRLVISYTIGRIV